MTEFGLERIDTQGPAPKSLKSETLLHQRPPLHACAGDAAFVPLAKRIFEDYDALGDVVNYETEGGGTAIDRSRSREYFDRIGAPGWMRELLECAYVTEYGLDAGEQSALNFVFLIGTGDLED